MRKRKVLTSLLLSCVLLTSIGGASQYKVGGVTKVNYQFQINGEKLDQNRNYLVLSKDNITYVPLRFISEKLGASVNYAHSEIVINSKEQEKPLTTDSEKIKEFERKLDLITKENSELRNRLEKTEEKLVDKNVYKKKLPIEVKTDEGLTIRVNDIIDEVNPVRTVYSITILNSSTQNTFAFKPEYTVASVGEKSYSPSYYTTKFLTTLGNLGSVAGSSVIDGNLEFDHAKVKGEKVILTFYYNVGNSSESKTAKIYLEI